MIKIPGTLPRAELILPFRQEVGTIFKKAWSLAGSGLQRVPFFIWCPTLSFSHARPLIFPQGKTFATLRLGER
jgi:hypothetical protein